MAEWGTVWQGVGVFTAVLFGSVGLFKIYHELKRLNEQRKKDLEDKKTALKHRRTEMFLAQHRRLFDNEDLYEVLSLIDNDDPKLACPDFSDKKRKFLVFFEEIELLCKSDQITRGVAVYMFGYYAKCAQIGPNFATGINMDKKHWALFFEFADHYSQWESSEDRSFPKDI